MFENLTREAGKQEIKQQNVPKLLHLKLIVFRTDILQKLMLGAPDTLDVCLCTTLFNKNTFNLPSILSN